MAMCARKELWEELKKRREVLYPKEVKPFFETIRGRTDRESEKEEKRVIARQQELPRLSELNRGMIIAR